MLSFSKFAPCVTEVTSGCVVDMMPPSATSSRFDLDHALRRAEEESIATIRSGETPAAERHREMASYYAIRALEIIDCRSRVGVAILQSA